VMNEPTPLDLAIVTYCLLDEKSRQTIKNIPLEVNGEEEETTEAHKLYCLMCKSNISDGMNNYNKILTGIVAQVQDSLSEPETKKKILVNPLLWILKKSMIR